MIQKIYNVTGETPTRISPEIVAFVSNESAFEDEESVLKAIHVDVNEENISTIKQYYNVKDGVTFSQYPSTNLKRGKSSDDVYDCYLQLIAEDADKSFEHFEAIFRRYQHKNFYVKNHVDEILENVRRQYFNEGELYTERDIAHLCVHLEMNEEEAGIEYKFLPSIDVAYLRMYISPDFSDRCIEETMESWKK